MKRDEFESLFAFSEDEFWIPFCFLCSITLPAAARVEPQLKSRMGPTMLEPAASLWRRSSESGRWLRRHSSGRTAQKSSDYRSKLPFWDTCPKVHTCYLLDWTVATRKICIWGQGSNFSKVLKWKMRKLYILSVIEPNQVFLSWNIYRPVSRVCELLKF